MKSAHVNVRSLCNKKDAISYILSQSKLDIFCITESWLDESILDSEVQVSGYVIERKDRNRQGGGVLLYIKESIKYARRSDISGASPAVENVWIEVKCSKNTVNIDSVLLGCFYRPPSSDTEYFDGILDIMEKASLDDKHIVILGDLNYDYEFNESLSTNPLHYIENLFGLTQLITDYTRVTPTSSSLLDVILSSLPSNVRVCNNVFSFSLSDHYLVFTCINAPPIKGDHRTITYRCYKNFDSELFLNDVIANDVFCSTNDNNECTYVKDTWETWKSNFLCISDKHAPIKVTRVKDRHNPWINAEIIKLMYRRDYLHKRA